MSSELAPGTDSAVAWQARAVQVLPGGVSSNVRLGAPRRFFARGAGARLWDVDGREYVDYLLGQGPAFLGHADPRIRDAVARTTADGMLFGAQHPLEVQAAERLIAALGWAEQVRFGVSGTESVQIALRLARAATGRRKVMRFAGSYHGWIDNVLADFSGGGARPASDGQPPEALADWVVAEFNSPDQVEAAFARDGDEIAAVLVEPMMCNSGAIEPEDGFLSLLRRRCDDAGAVLVFDEVITGFRLGLGGAVERYGVTPDLAVYGKAMAGGWPVSALAGPAALFDAVGTGRVNHSGTFNGSVMAAAAVLATLDALGDDPPYARIADHGGRLMDGLREVGRRCDVPLRVEGVPAAFHVSFAVDEDDEEPVRRLADLARRDLSRYAALSHALADEGLWVAGRGIWYVSAAHRDAELDDALEIFERTLRRGERPDAAADGDGG